VHKAVGKRKLGCPGRRWEINIQVDIRKMILMVGCGWNWV
jgi:hypothetical protein